MLPWSKLNVGVETCEVVVVGGVPAPVVQILPPDGIMAVLAITTFKHLFSLILLAYVSFQK